MFKLDSKQLKRTTILYVEDDMLVRKQTEKVLKKLFKKVYVATDGKEGLVLYTKHISSIDLIVTDINMPNMDGLEMIKGINNLNKSIPTIVTTAHSESHYLIKAIDINVDKYITKPIQIKELTLNIIELVSKYKRINNIENLAKTLVQKTNLNDKENRELNNEVESIKNQKRYLESIVDNMVLHCKIDKNGHFLEVSTKLKLFFEYSNIIGKNINILQSENCEQETFQKLMLKAIHTKKTIISKYCLVTKSERKVDMEVTMTSLYGKDALVKGYLVYFDIL